MPIKASDYGGYFDRSKSWRQRLEGRIAGYPAAARDFLKRHEGADRAVSRARGVGPLRLAEQVSDLRRKGG